MMAVQAIENKNFNFLIKSFNEEFNFSNSFFENSIKGSFYEYPSTPKVYMYIMVYYFYIILTQNYYFFQLFLYVYFVL